MIRAPIRAALAALLMLACVTPGDVATAAGPSQPPAAPAGQTFTTADEAVKALVDAVRADNLDALRGVLGPGSERLVNSGDKVADAERRRRFLAAHDERHELAAAEPGRMILKVGKDDWPLPIPVVQADGRWHFDTQAGAQELIDRWIGRNEIAAIRTALACVDAQKAFVAANGEYAQRLLSTPGKHDGLYWEAGNGEPESPLAPLVAQAREEGYPVDRGAAGPRPYQGYYFRILTGQGPNTPEGARSYLANDRMIRGFGLIAWPASYGSSGIMSFVVNQDGIVYQKDLGARTAAIARATKLFDPDLSWTRIDVIN